MFRNRDRRRAGFALPRIIGAVVGLGLATTLIATTNSYFGHTTGSPPDSWTAGSVVISDNSEGAALFSASGIAPGWSEEADIVVTNSSTITDPDGVKVRMYATGISGDLADALEVDVEFDGTPIVTDATLSSFANSWDNWVGGPGHDGWVSAGGAPDETATYTITVSFPETGEDQSDFEGDSAAATFVWEARSTSTNAP